MHILCAITAPTPYTAVYHQNNKPSIYPMVLVNYVYISICSSTISYNLIKIMLFTLRNYEIYKPKS